MEMDDAFFSIRFKHGIHTIFLFVDAHSTFADLSSKLLKVLRERYAEGALKLSATSGDTTSIPPGKPNIYFARLKNANDKAEGWEPLDVGERDTPSRLGIEDNSMLAFAFEEGGFEVEFPNGPEELLMDGI